MSRRLTQAEIEELLLAVGDPTTQKEVEQRSKLTKLSKSIINMGDKLRVTGINILDALRNAHKKRQFEKWCQEQGIFGVHVVGGNGQINYDEMQRLIQESTDKIYQAIQADATQKENPPEREM